MNPNSKPLNLILGINYPIPTMDLLDSLNPFPPLFDPELRPTGTLALAVRCPKGRLRAVSYLSDITSEQITELWPLIEDSFQQADHEKLSARRIHFMGRLRELHCFQRTDGAILAVLMDGKEAARSVQLKQLAGRFECWGREPLHLPT
jgi:hypothetical protein